MILNDYLDNSFLHIFTNINLSVKSDPIIFTNEYFILKYEQAMSVARVFVNEYWAKAQRNGFGVNILDDIIMIFVFVRFLILTLRYNFATSIIITASSTAAAWLWYNNFITLLFLYENALYKNALTFRLGVDATQIRKIGEGRLHGPDFGIRITNPLGILLHAINRGSSYDYHRIDPISMLTAQCLDSKYFGSEVKKVVESTYYLLYRELIPLGALFLRRAVRFFSSYIYYMMVVRVGREVTPYIIRWHWTYVYLVSALQGYILHLINRCNEYSILKIYPKIVAAKEFGLAMPRQEYEMKIIYLLCFTCIIAHLCFILFAMFHALIGQYFYVPFFTQNVELHIGSRDKNSIYSGGYTAWQDKEEQTTGFRALFPKLWYGWFGRGTLKPNFIIRLIDYLIFYPIYSIALKIITRIQEFMDWFLWWIR